MECECIIYDIGGYSHLLLQYVYSKDQLQVQTVSEDVRERHVLTGSTNLPVFFVIQHPVLLTEAPLNPRKNRVKAAEVIPTQFTNNYLITITLSRSFLNHSMYQLFTYLCKQFLVCKFGLRMIFSIKCYLIDLVMLLDGLQVLYQTQVMGLLILFQYTRDLPFLTPL